jgi:2-methylisocitrate lyase-like PEP mutase family enzyme
MPLANQEMTKKLQEIFRRPGLTIVPGGATPYHAIMAEKAGFEAFYISGAMSHRWLLGQPDSGQLTTSEFADNGRRIASVVNIPVFSDADTGGGSAINAYRTVKEYIRAGLAGCHIEDVQFPKGITTAGQSYGSIGGHSNARLISLEEAVLKLKAAAAAKSEMDPNFVLIARTDGRNAIGCGFDEAIRRAQEYEKIPGVDVIQFDGMNTWDECREANKSVKLPVFHTGTLFGSLRDASGNLLPLPTVEQREKDGEKIYMLVGAGLQSADQAAWEMLTAIRSRGTGPIEVRSGTNPGRPDPQTWLGLLEHVSPCAKRLGWASVSTSSAQTHYKVIVILASLPAAIGKGACKRP